MERERPIDPVEARKQVLSPIVRGYISLGDAITKTNNPEEIARLKDSQTELIKSFEIFHVVQLESFIKFRNANQAVVIKRKEQKTLEEMVKEQK